MIAYGTPITQVALFGAYVAFGIALPGMLWVRLLRDRATHIAEDLALGLGVGYCVEVALYIPARALGAPLLFLFWPILTLVGFALIPALRRHWRGGGTRAPVWWSWTLAAVAGFLLIYSAGTFFAQHHLTGTDTPYVDLPFQLTLIGELRHHVPPQVPYVADLPLAYHWFYYAEAAATSWATGIEPLTLLYRLSGLPMILVFVVLTATAARRLTAGWWTGPVAVAVALFGIVAGPYGWTPASVFDTQMLQTLWGSPTHLFGIALFAATILVFIDLLRREGPTRRADWLLGVVLVFGVAGAKASLLPLLIGGLLTVVVGVWIGRRRLQADAVVGLGLAVAGLALATVLLFQGSSGGLAIGLGALQSFPVALSVGARGVSGAAAVVPPLVALSIAIVLWSFVWAGAYGLLVRWRESLVDPSILLLIGICAAALGAVSFFLYPGLSELYYVRGAAGAFGLLTAAGLARFVRADTRRGPVVAAAGVAVLAGTGIVTVIKSVGLDDAPRLGQDRLSAVVLAMTLPVVALMVAVIVGFLVARMAERRIPRLQGAVPLLVIALVMGFSLPRIATILTAPFTAPSTSGVEIPAHGIAAARWLRDNSEPDDVVATNLHCRPLPETPDVCDARQFWVSAYAERHMLVEGWAYTTPASTYGLAHKVSVLTTPFWDPRRLAANDAAFTNPSPPNLAALRDGYGVRWLFADMTSADSDALGREADLRFREGDFAVYELRRT